MDIETIVAIGSGTVVALIIAALLYRHTPKPLKRRDFLDNWRKLQNFCRSQSTWPDALLDADKLLDKALKKRNFKGKSMGERMVSARKQFMNNDAVWFAHSLTKKVIADPDLKVKEEEIKSALVSYRDALKDLGALPNGESTKPK